MRFKRDAALGRDARFKRDAARFRRDAAVVRDLSEMQLSREIIYSDMRLSIVRDLCEMRLWREI